MTLNSTFLNNEIYLFCFPSHVVIYHYQPLQILQPSISNFNLKFVFISLSPSRQLMRTIRARTGVAKVEMTGDGVFAVKF